MAFDVARAEPVFRNGLLGALSPEDSEYFSAHLQQVTLALGQVLHVPGEQMQHVYFPESSLVSLVADSTDNGFVEIGITGREGMVGSSVVLNPDAFAVHRAMVHGAGSAVRMRTAAFNQALNRSPAFRTLCLRYVQVLMVQASQAAACNARHELPERLARWLLMNRDRTENDDMPLTTEFLALMLGIRRTGVSVIANALQSTGAIWHSRGRITILNRELLEDEACSCYRFIEDAQEKIMGSSNQIIRVRAC